MTLNELGDKLKQMHSEAPKGDTVVMINLFGIKFADEINQNKYSKKEIIELSGIPIAYLIELSKGIKLAKYVNVNE